MSRFFGLNVWLAVLIVAGLQSAALGYMVIDRAQLLQNGDEITLDVRPVDPRSLFRGDYVILNYGSMSRIDGALFRELRGGTRQVYVTLRKGAESWAPVAVTAAYPKTEAAGDVVLRGDVDEHYRDRLRSVAAVPVDYGIESYFVPEGEGKKLEKLIRKGELRVIAAIGADGRAAIKGIEARGKRVYEEPVW